MYEPCLDALRAYLNKFKVKESNESWTWAHLEQSKQAKNPMS